MNVWGRIIFRQSAYPDIPKDLAASNCPFGTEAKPPRKISMTNAALFKVIAKIPLVGDLLVGKKTGEGVFGVSFKIKGPPKDLKTTVNPVKTLTPRFITRTLEKLKKN